MPSKKPDRVNLVGGSPVHSASRLNGRLLQIGGACERGWNFECRLRRLCLSQPQSSDMAFSTRGAIPVTCPRRSAPIAEMFEQRYRAGKVMPSLSQQLLASDGVDGQGR
jgi:hypothetical protein